MEATGEAAATASRRSVLATADPSATAAPQAVRNPARLGDLATEGKRTGTTDPSSTAAGVLATLGDLLEDVAVHPRTAIREATDTPCAIRRRRGGSAANVATAAAALLGAGRVRFLGRVGDDPLGSRLLAEVEEAGVRACVQRGGRTGSVVVLVDEGGERTMLTDRGDSLAFDKCEEGWLEDVKMLHVPGYSLMGGALAETAMAAISVVRAGGGAVSVDANSVGSIADVGVKTFCRALSEAAPDLLICNRSEADLLADTTAAGRRLDATADPPADTTVTGRRLDTTATGRRLDAAVRVTKDGPRAAVLSRKGRKDVLIEPPETLRAVDTTGAGDAFAGGLLAARLLGADWCEAVRAGHRSANAHLKSMGAEPLETTETRPPEAAA